MPEPETITAHGQTWNTHTPGDPMPCDGEARIYTLCRWELNVKEWLPMHCLAKFTGWGKDAAHPSLEVIAWRFRIP